MKRGQIQRLPDAVLTKKIRRKQLIGRKICGDLSRAHQNDPVNTSVQHVLQPVLDDDDRRAGFFANFVDELDGLLARRGVKVCQRLVKEQDRHIVHHHTGQTHALLLAAGELVRRVQQMLLHAGLLRRAENPLVKRGLFHAVVFQREGDILRNRQPDKLPVGVLQNGADHFGNVKEAERLRLPAHDLEASLLFAAVGKRNEAV